MARKNGKRWKGRRWKVKRKTEIEERKNVVHILIPDSNILTPGSWIFVSHLPSHVSHLILNRSSMARKNGKR